jgi:MarR family 2-MHQ and catechol resistance regulon transcriptional repressor
MSDTSEEIDFVSAFKDAQKRIQRLSEKNLASIGLSVTEVRILRSLSVNGPSPMAKFAGELYMTPASITGLIDKLEGEGLVERERGTADRRVVTVTITPKGRERLEAGLKLNQRFVTHALKSLSREETRQLVELLNKLAEAAAIT